MTYSKKNKDRDYRILGLKNPSSLKEIKKAYKNKARKLHPDIRQNDKQEAEEDFKELSEAYSNLKDGKTKHPSKSANESQKTSNEDNNLNHNSFRRNNFNSYKDIFNSLFSILGQDIFPLRTTNTKIVRNKLNSQTIDVRGLDTCRFGHKPLTICLECRS